MFGRLGEALAEFGEQRARAYRPMLEVRIHGRSGQGSIVAASLLAAAAVEEGLHAMIIPPAVGDGRGDRVAAGVRIDARPIPREAPAAGADFLIIQDESLLHADTVFAGLNPGCGVLVNSARKPSTLGVRTRVHTIPATQFALDHLGRPIPNTALLAAFLALTDLLPLEALLAALAAAFDGDVLEANRRTVGAVAEDLRSSD